MEIKAPAEEYLKAVLCYPAYDADAFSERLSELTEAGVSELVSKGPSSISRWHILGKGHVGIVVAAKYLGAEVALKILRTDADRTSLEREGLMLAYANAARVGPTLIACTKNFLISELIEGIPIVRQTQPRIKSNVLKRCVRTLIFQGFRLDMAGIDHGELSRPHKHVLLQPRGDPVILDFESASLNRRSNNLLSLVQFLFIRRQILRDNLRPADSSINSNKLLKALRAYKANMSPKNYHAILHILEL